MAGQSGTVSSAHLLDTFLIDQAPIIVGYSGWENDVIMKRIKERISYPTPLQYIWVCYNQKSYDKLPDWLKESSSFIFVVPVIHDEICEDTSCGNDFINKVDEPVIDAAKFFKRLIYELEIPSPTILTNPYEYFSKEINTLLPRNEDVLHLRHWTQRLKLLEKNNSKFEVAVRALEQHFLAKDYNSAAKIEYIKCCGIICITSRSEYEKLEYANRAFSLLENFPHMCDALITSLFYILLPYFQLSPSIVSKREM